MILNSFFPRKKHDAVAHIGLAAQRAHAPDASKNSPAPVGLRLAQASLGQVAEGNLTPRQHPRCLPLQAPGKSNVL
jgi:hypothetical protein